MYPRRPDGTLNYLSRYTGAKLFFMHDGTGFAIESGRWDYGREPRLRFHHCDVQLVGGSEHGRPRSASGGVRGDFDNEIGVESSGDPFEQGDSRHDTASFQPGQGGLGHAGTGGELGLGQP